jgi:hypothetical protein
MVPAAADAALARKFCGASELLAARDEEFALQKSICQP